MAQQNTITPASLERRKGKYIGTVNLTNSGDEVGFFVLWDTGHVEISLDHAAELKNLCLSMDETRPLRPCELTSMFGPQLPSNAQTTLDQLARELNFHGSKLFVSLRDASSACWEVQIECD